MGTGFVSPGAARACSYAWTTAALVVPLPGEPLPTDGIAVVEVFPSVPAEVRVFRDDTDTEVAYAVHPTIVGGTGAQIGLVPEGGWAPGVAYRVEVETTGRTVPEALFFTAGDGPNAVPDPGPLPDDFGATLVGGGASSCGGNAIACLGLEATGWLEVTRHHANGGSYAYIAHSWPHVTFSGDPRPGTCISLRRWTVDGRVGPEVERCLDEVPYQTLESLGGGGLSDPPVSSIDCAFALSVAEDIENDSGGCACAVDDPQPLAAAPLLIALTAIAPRRRRALSSPAGPRRGRPRGRRGRRRRPSRSRCRGRRSRRRRPRAGRRSPWAG